MLKSALTFAVVLAATAVPAAAQNRDVGEELFQQFCQSCHGPAGDGHGPVAQFLNVPPPDLTTIAARNDGEFPMLQVIQTIDGRNIIGPHGGAMPMWGAVFSGDMGETMQTYGYGTVLEARGRLMSLAMYLESIQQ